MKRHSVIHNLISYKKYLPSVRESKEIREKISLEKNLSLIVLDIKQIIVFRLVQAQFTDSTSMKFLDRNLTN